MTQRVADVPERKEDFDQGRCKYAAPEGKTTVAVKVMDMLNEEVLVTEEIG